MQTTDIELNTTKKKEKKNQPQNHKNLNLTTRTSKETTIWLSLQSLSLSLSDRLSNSNIGVHSFSVWLSPLSLLLLLWTNERNRRWESGEFEGDDEVAIGDHLDQRWVLRVVASAIATASNGGGAHGSWPWLGMRLRDQRCKRDRELWRFFFFKFLNDNNFIYKISKSYQNDAILGERISLKEANWRPSLNNFRRRFRLYFHD